MYKEAKETQLWKIKMKKVEDKRKMSQKHEEAWGKNDVCHVIGINKNNWNTKRTVKSEWD